jgi:apolipoprotein N-acyltransferase
MALDRCSATESVTRARAVWLVVAATAGSAGLFYVGTGLAPIAALAWLAPLPVLLVAPRVPGVVAATAAFLACLFGMTNTWGWYAHSYDVPLPWGVLITVGFAVIFCWTVLIFRALLRRGRALLAVAAAPAVWTGALYLISEVNPQGIAGTMATTQADIPVVLQMVSVTGAWGLEYLVIMVPSSLAALLAPAVATAARVRIATVAGIVVATVLVGGAVRLAGISGGEGTQRVALIAHNRDSWAPDLDTPAARELLAGYLRQIAALPAGVRTVVLPEGAFGSRAAAPAALLEPMSRLAQERGVDIVVGFAWWDGDDKYNYALTFPARGGEPVRYLKFHDMVSQPGRELVFPPAAGARMGVVICADVNFRDPISRYATADTKLLAIPAADEDDNGWQHSRTALLRGVENGQSVAWGGRKTRLLLADGFGRVFADAPTGGQGEFTVAVGDVPIGPGATHYSRFGDWFALGCLGLVLIGLVGLTGLIGRRGSVGGRVSGSRVTCEFEADQ